MIEVIIGIFIWLVGTCFGSFITAASHRLPRDMDLVKARSACPKCGAVLEFKDLLPVFSWVFSRGKCRHCSAGVSIRYPLTEVLTGLIFVLLWLKFGLAANFFIFTALSVALLTMIIADFETYIIPDSTTIAALLLGFAYHYHNTENWQPFIAGFVVCLLVGLFLHYGYYLLTKKHGLGFGDVKFLPVAGLWVGINAIPPYLVLSGVLGVVTGLIWRSVTGSREFPFGPALAISMFIFAVFPALGSLISY